MRWSDMDALGHVHNATFLEYLELARLPVFLGVREAAGAGTHFVVARHTIDYRAELRYRPEPLLVDIWVNHVGRSSCELGYRIHDWQPDVTYADATTVVVNVDAGSRRSAPWTEAQRAILVGLRPEEAP